MVRCGAGTSVALLVLCKAKAGSEEQMNAKQRARKTIQGWLDKAESGILNSNCAVTLEAIDSMTLKQMQAMLKLVCANYSSGYQDGSKGTRELLLKKYRTNHVLKIDSHSGNVSIYDAHGEFVDKVNNLDEADRLVNKRLSGGAQ